MNEIDEKADMDRYLQFEKEQLKSLRRTQNGEITGLTAREKGLIANREDS
jgi:hypothetical protein